MSMSVVLVKEMAVPKYIQILLAASIVNVTVVIYLILMDLSVMEYKEVYIPIYIHVYPYNHVYLKINTLSTCVDIYMYINVYF